MRSHVSQVSLKHCYILENGPWTSWSSCIYLSAVRGMHHRIQFYAVLRTKSKASCKQALDEQRNPSPKGSDSVPLLTESDWKKGRHSWPHPFVGSISSWQSRCKFCFQAEHCRTILPSPHWPSEDIKAYLASVGGGRVITGLWVVFSLKEKAFQSSSCFLELPTIFFNKYSFSQAIQILIIS